jgi:hypothetical protein
LLSEAARLVLLCGALMVFLGCASGARDPVTWD